MTYDLDPYLDDPIPRGSFTKSLATTAGPLVVPPAVREWIAEQTARDTRDLIRALLTLATAGEISQTCASRILNAAGIGLTPGDVEDAITYMDTVDDPASQLDREIADLGPVSVSREQALTDIAGAAQGDLDDLIARGVAFALPVSTPVAVLAAVRLLTGVTE